MRSVVLCLAVMGLAIPFFADGWPYGVNWQGIDYTMRILSINVAAGLACSVLRVLNRRRPLNLTNITSGWVRGFGFVRLLCRLAHDSTRCDSMDRGYAFSLRDGV